MKTKTARRWLTRNKWKMALHRTKVSVQGASFVKRWKECVKVLTKEEGQDNV